MTIVSKPLNSSRTQPNRCGRSAESGRTKQDLSRPEWIFLAQYIHCCESVENPRMPGPDAYTQLLEALLAVRDLRADRGFGLDRYYLGNLGLGDDAVFNERQFDPDLIPQTVRRIIQQLRGELELKKPPFAGRNFYVALRDEELADITKVNHVLQPYMDTLWAWCTWPLAS